MDLLDAHVLILDKDPKVCAAAKIVLAEIFTHIHMHAEVQSLEALLQHQNFDIILLDVNYSTGQSNKMDGLRFLKEILLLVPGQKVVMMTAFGNIKLAIEAIKSGAVDFVVKPWDNEKLKASMLAILKKTKVKKIILEGAISESTFVQKSSLMKLAIKVAKKVAPTDAAVLLTGESGSGKNDLASFIHANSNRAMKPLLKVDLQAITPDMLESELFGLKSDTLPNASQERLGTIFQADTGTLFLNGIDNLPLVLQSRLLSILQTKAIPIGTNQKKQVDFRLVCATDKSLQKMVKKNPLEKTYCFISTRLKSQFHR